MTANKDLKRLVRARMAKTGESYTAALRYIRALNEKERDMNQQVNQERVLNNRFVLKEKLGGDLVGDVYRALDKRQQEVDAEDPYVALKILKKSIYENKNVLGVLQKSASRARDIRSEHTLSVYDFDRDGDTPYMTLELLEGEPLSEYLKKHASGLPRDDAMAVIRGICSAFVTAHAQGVLHGDFKPGNVFYTKGRVAKVYDFGVALAFQEAGITASDLKRTYASYESLHGASPSTADDVFAVALVAYEVLTGQHPYQSETAEQARAQGLEPEPVPGLTDEQWQALRKALTLRASDRTESMEEFAKGVL